MYEKTWGFSFDNAYTPADALDLTRYELWALKAMLTNQLGAWSPAAPTAGFWTCYGSSDSVTAGLDGTDRWLAAYDGTKIVRGTAAAVRSWWVGRSPATLNSNTFYVCLHFDGAADTSATIVFSKTAFTGGSTTARPTSVDEWTSSTLGATWNVGGAALQHKFNIGLTTQGSWYWFACRAGDHRHNLGIMCMAPVSCHISDPFPVYTFKMYTAVSASTCGFDPDQITITSAGSGNTRLATGATGVAHLPFAAIRGGGNSVDMLTNAQVDLPCWVIAGDPAGGSWHGRGRLPDIGYSPAGVASTLFPDGYVVREAGNIVAYTCGGFMLPGDSCPNFF